MMNESSFSNIVRWALQVAVAVLFFSINIIAELPSLLRATPPEGDIPGVYGVMVTDDYETELLFRDGYELIGIMDRTNFVCRTSDNRFVYCQPVERKRVYFDETPKN